MECAGEVAQLVAANDASAAAEVAVRHIDDGRSQVLNWSNQASGNECTDGCSNQQHEQRQDAGVTHHRVYRCECLTGWSLHEHTPAETRNWGKSRQHLLLGAVGVLRDAALTKLQSGNRLI